MAVLVDSYSESNRSTDAALSSDASHWKKYGQSFTSTGGTLDSCKFVLSIVGSPTGNAVAEVFAHSGTFGTSSVGTGAALATSDNLNVATLNGTPTLTTLNFSGANRISLVDTTKYMIVISFTGGDLNNALGVGVDTTSPTHGGNRAGWTGAAWQASSAADVCFYTYKADAAVTLRGRIITI